MSASSPRDTGIRGNASSGETVGVQELIDRLKSEGVEEGQLRADALLAEAKRQAVIIVDAAHAEADKLVKEAQRHVAQTQANGKRALALASRDASLQLKEHLQHEFRGWVGRLVLDQSTDPNFVAELIRELAGQAIAAFSDDPISDGPISGGPDTQDSKQPAKLRFLVGGGESKPLEEFIRGEAAEMLRQGVCLQADRSLTHGFRVQLVDQNLELDFTDEAVTAALMRFLAPKFRQLIGSASEEAESA